MMAYSTCNTCTQWFHWNWEEAFDKFGFGDGDGQIETWTVKHTLTVAGYDVEIRQWGMHNTIITSIVKDGFEFIPSDVSFGYDNPRDYLSTAIVKLLDKAFPARTPYCY
jgi:hypothetical protein